MKSKDPMPWVQQRKSAMETMEIELFFFSRQILVIKGLMMVFYTASTSFSGSSQWEQKYAPISSWPRPMTSPFTFNHKISGR